MAVPALRRAMSNADDQTAHRRMLGRYEIVGRIATGGMATVYLARLQGTGGFNREFALKVVHPHLAEQVGFGDRFLREARLASRVRHHNIVATIDAGEALGYSYLVLELVEGLTVRQLMLHRDGGLGCVDAAQIVADAARGLHALHSAADENGAPLSIVHRDLSPQNIMVDRHGRTVLIDLGLAKARENPETTEVGVMIGKLPYMSPEQARLETVDARSDIFALGSVLFELVTDTMPFGGSHTTETLERLQACDPVPIARALAEHDAPNWLMEAVLTCLRADPAERFASAEALAEALTQALQAAGHDAPDNRRHLAQIVAAAVPQHGKITPAAGLQPRDPPAHAEPRRASWRWAVAGAAVVGVGLAALRVSDGLDTPPTDGSATPIEARDDGDARPVGPPAPTSTAAPDRATVEPTTPMDPEPGYATTGEVSPPDPPEPVRASPRRASRPGKVRALKPNPYDTR